MIIGGGRRGDYGGIKKEANTASPLLMYTEPPETVISFDEFATCALERFSVLQLFETASTKYLKGSSEYLSKIEVELRKLGFFKTILCNVKSSARYPLRNFYIESQALIREPLIFGTILPDQLQFNFDIFFKIKKALESIDQTELSKDIISHFVLRLAFCKTDELKRWFISQEVDLFRYKLSKISNDKEVIENFIRDNELTYTPISETEKNQVLQSLTDLYGSTNQVLHQNFYKVDYKEVIDLVKQRRVFIKGGYAYVTISDFTSILTNIFRSKLSLGLTMLSRNIKSIEEDQRISELLAILRERNVGDSYAETEAREHLTAESIEQLALKSFPPCMRNLHESLKHSHHLKHYGRLQYVLFLKGIGIPMEENLKFWRNEFAKGSVPPEKFEKEYAYNIRHSYGREGKRTSYTPYSCLKIITSHLPAAGDHHGCPFKHFDRDFLKQKLKQYGRTEDEVHQITDLVDGSGYQLACQRYFEVSHKTEEIIQVNHPNQYFEQSYRLNNGHYLNKPTNNRQQTQQTQQK